MIRFALFVKPFACLAAMFWMASSSAGAADTTPTFALSNDGAYVIDVQAKLAWPRCAEGMRWNGRTCTGQAQRLSYAKATELARARRKVDGAPWRVPRLTELRRLAGKVSEPTGIDPVLFPNAPRDWHWSATANIEQVKVNQYNYGNIMRGRTDESSVTKGLLAGWAVNLEDGKSRGDLSRNTKLSVRLVMSIE